MTPEHLENAKVNEVDRQYLALLDDILHNGEESADRTGTGTKKVFGRMLTFNLDEVFLS